MTIWRFIDSGDCDAAHNMALDEAIATCVRSGDLPPTLRLYGWGRPSVSIGSFQKVSDINLRYCAANNIPVVRRPTGGRGILHGDELTYSFSSKNEVFFSKGLLDAYRRISAVFRTAFEMIGLKTVVKEDRESGINLTRSPLCFLSTSFGEVSYEGRKLIGSAQKRWNDGFLQQGSIPYSIDHEKMQAVFKSSEKSNPPRGMMTGLRELIRFSPDEFKLHIKTAFERSFGVRFVESHPSLQEEALAHSLASGKYRSHQWTGGETRGTRFCNNSEKSRTA